MKYSVEDVKKSMPETKAMRDPLWLKLWVRPLSYPLACLALNMGLAPNTVSVISILDAVCAGICMSAGCQKVQIAGLVILNAFIVFDCMDGTMARTLKRDSYMGEFFDAAGGYSMCAVTLAAAGICAFHSQHTMYISDYRIIMIGALGSLCDVTARLIYQSYTVREMMADSKMGRTLKRDNDLFYTKEVSKKSITYMRMEFDRQFGIGGLMPPAILLSYLLKCMDAVISIYMIYHLLACIMSFIIYCRKAEKFDRDAGREVSG